MNFDLFHTDDIRVEYCSNSRRDIQRVLDACRDERRPYLVIKKSSTKNLEPRQVTNNAETTHINLDSWFLTPESTILVPVSMLEEDVYKAEICTYLARKTGAHIILLRANDYGSKAKQNTQRIITHIQTISERTGTSISYEERTSKRDSFHIHKELPQLVSDIQDEDKGEVLILLTASREYGLDDWLLGPPEQYVVYKSPAPVMLINPRADLFSLCD